MLLTATLKLMKRNHSLNFGVVHTRLGCQKSSRETPETKSTNLSRRTYRKIRKGRSGKSVERGLETAECLF